MEVCHFRIQTFRMPNEIICSSPRHFQDHSPNSPEDVSLNFPKVLTVRATKFMQEQKYWDALNVNLWVCLGRG